MCGNKRILFYFSFYYLHGSIHREYDYVVFTHKTIKWKMNSRITQRMQI